MQLTIANPIDLEITMIDHTSASVTGSLFAKLDAGTYVVMASQEPDHSVTVSIQGKDNSARFTGLKIPQDIQQQMAHQGEKITIDDWIYKYSIHSTISSENTLKPGEFALVIRDGSNKTGTETTP